MESLLKKISKYDAIKLSNFLNNEKLSVLHQFKSHCDDRYYNSIEGISMFTDEQYDILLEIIIKKEDTNYILPVGAKISNHQQKVTLPFHLGSMTKYKTEEDIQKWYSKNKVGEFIVEEKLDGVSCLFICENSNISIYTRGDGSIGTNISHLSKYIRNLPKKIPNIILRGELIIQADIFMKKYKEEMANPRNMVSGLVNSQTIRTGVNDIDFVAYEILDTKLIPSDQMNFLRKLKFQTISFNIIHEINKTVLSQLLVSMKRDSIYDIDGIIIQNNTSYTRNTSGNPSYAFAFKMNTETCITEVEEVVWNISKHKMLKPTIRVKPVNLNGVVITFTSGFNANYIKENNLGKGSLIELTRSGDVIPYIVNIIKQSKEPGMPKVPFTWNDTGIDIYVNDDEENISEIKRVASFFSNLKIKNISEITIQKMFDYGFDDLFKILSANIEDFRKIDTFGDKLSEKLYSNIHAGLKDVTIPLLCGSYNVFGMGFGRRKVDLLFSSLPDLFDLYHSLSTEELIGKINSVEGFSQKSSEKILINIPFAIEFIQQISPFISLKKDVNTCENSLENMKFVMSGFRNDELEDYITKRAGKITSSVSKNTTAIIVKDKTSSSSKVDKARDLGLGIYDINEFYNKF